MNSFFKRKIFYILLSIILLTISLVYIFLNAHIITIINLPIKTYVSLDDVSIINNEKIYGDLIEVSLEKDELAVGEDGYKTGKVIFKLFGLIPIKTVEVEIIKDEKVYVGGNPLGFSIKTKGVIVVGTNSVLTENGSVNTLEGLDLKIGDVITHINNNQINDVEEMINMINKEATSDTSLELKGYRNNKLFNLKITPAYDSQSKRFKLGLWVRDDASGVGTLTFVEQESLKFGALGHPITDSETGAKVDVQNGKVYACSLVGIEKGEKGKPGQLKGVFLEGKKHKGIIINNTDFGLFGEINDKNSIIDENLIVNISGRLAVKPGKAKIISSVSGVREEYDIEIIKANKQNSAKDKSLVIRITDKRLLKLTGGIVQGMSGSPILQNGKMVGAITHVFVSDPTKGYGIYIDWMQI